MSTKYSGGIITKSPVTPAGPYENGTAPGVWTVEQALQYTKQGIWPTQGNQDPANIYIEYLFSTYLYTGTGATQTITNGIDILGKGAMVWTKIRSAADSHILEDTVRGVGKDLSSNSTLSQQSNLYTLQSFLNNGYTVAQDSTTGAINEKYVSWTFRKQPKFFDVVTFTTDSTGAATVSHALGSTPAFVIVKRTDSTGLWFCWHTSLPSTNYYLFLNLTNAQTNSGGTWLTPSSTQVSFPSNSLTGALASSASYVMYVYASNAGGFGLTGTDNVISCGSYTTDGSSNATITLGYEPQWVLTKRTDGGGGAWGFYDTMRGWSFSAQNYLLPNDSGAEGTINSTNFKPTATGFTVGSPYDSSATYIYIAIRRGPMKVPTDATKVFVPAAQTDTTPVTTNFPVDFFLENVRAGSVYNTFAASRLTGNTPNLRTSSTNAEETGNMGADTFTSNTKLTLGIFGVSAAIYAFQRAPSFFDEVCYTGDNAATRTLAHNLTVAPEWIILRKRNSSGYWYTYFNFGSTSCSILQLEDTVGAGSSAYTGLFSKLGGAPTSSSFIVTNPYFGETNLSGTTYIAYLFATCAGVSKVGSYTGTGATQTINCGFGAGGSRFVLIKRTDSTGDWYVWDSARGMVSGTDPSLLLNSTAAEVNANSIYTISTGFQIVSTAAGINASGGTYIFLAIA